MERIHEIYRDSAERVRDFQEVERRLETNELMEQAGRCMSCGIPFCHGAGCPLQNSIPDINAAAAGGDWETAYKILSLTSNFPEFTSRVCPALCEGSCVNGINSEAVMIRQIEKAVIERAFAGGYVYPKKKAPATGKHVAVIGAGPAGLAAADRLNRAGHRVTVFEKNANPGGLLRYGIPNFKLDKSIIDRRVALMKDAGIQFECGAEVGSDLASEYLIRKFDAVVIAVGTQSPRNLPVPGRDADGVHFALEFLGAQNRYLTGEIPERSICAKDRRVLVIGGGDTGSDCVGTSLRQGAKSIAQIEIMPIPPLDRTKSCPWPDWPMILRTSSSHKEGGERRWNLLTKNFKVEDGRVTGANVVRVDWTYSEKGLPAKFTEVPGSEEFIPADLVLLAMGFLGVPEKGLASDLGLEKAPRGGVKSRPEKGIFVCGDAARGQSLVVRAIRDANQTVAQVNEYLSR